MWWGRVLIYACILLGVRDESIANANFFGRLAQKVVDNLGGGAKSSRFLGPCTQKIELGILIEEVSPRSTNIQSERVAFYLTLSARFFVYDVLLVPLRLTVPSCRPAAAADSAKL